MNLAILALGIATLGVGIGVGTMVSRFFTAAARQPEMYDKLFTTLFIGVAFIEGSYFITLAMAFVLR